MNMGSYVIASDAASDIVTCRITAVVPGNEMQGLIRDLKTTVDHARTQGSLRLLWDGRIGNVFPQDVADALQAILYDSGSPHDRVAIIVPDSVAKASARPRMTPVSQLFASENAALTWLSIGRAAAAA